MIAVVTGGAGSGKSALAEDIACTLAGTGPLVYLATMIPSGTEAKARVARHRAKRAGRGFVTVERAHDLAGLVCDALRLPESHAHGSAASPARENAEEKRARHVSHTIAPAAPVPANRPPIACADCAQRELPLWNGATVLVEDTGNLVANELFDDGGALTDPEQATARALQGIEALQSVCAHLIIVANEVGCGAEGFPQRAANAMRVAECAYRGEAAARIAPSPSSAHVERIGQAHETSSVGEACAHDAALEAYLRAIGTVNCTAAARADAVAVCTAGIATFIKGADPRVRPHMRTTERP